jgi:hypothetical protein
MQRSNGKFKVLEDSEGLVLATDPDNYRYQLRILDLG